MLYIIVYCCCRMYNILLVLVTEPCSVFVRVYVVNHRMPRGLFGWLLFYFMWPFRFTFDTLWNIFGFASTFVISLFHRSWLCAVSVSNDDYM